MRSVVSHDHELKSKVLKVGIVTLRTHIMCSSDKKTGGVEGRRREKEREREREDGEQERETNKSVYCVQICADCYAAVHLHCAKQLPGHLMVKEMFNQRRRESEHGTNTREC